MSRNFYRPHYDKFVKSLFEQLQDLDHFLDLEREDEIKETMVNVWNSLKNIARLLTCKEDLRNDVRKKIIMLDFTLDVGIISDNLLDVAMARMGGYKEQVHFGFSSIGELFFFGRHPTHGFWMLEEDYNADNFDVAVFQKGHLPVHPFIGTVADIVLGQTLAKRPLMSEDYSVRLFAGMAEYVAMSLQFTPEDEEDETAS